MQGRLRAALVLVAMTAIGCTSVDCRTVDCSATQVTVEYFRDQQLANASQLRLCVDDACDPAMAPTSFRIAYDAAHLTHEDGLRVRLDVLDGDGAVVRSLPGKGSITGECCRGLSLKVSDDERSLVSTGGSSSETLLSGDPRIWIGVGAIAGAALCVGLAMWSMTVRPRRQK